MDRWKKALLFIIPAVLLVACIIIIGILLTPTERPLKDPLAHYQAVADKLASLPMQASKVEIETVTQVQGQVFTENTSVSIQRKFQDGQLLLTVADRTVSIGEFQFYTQERLKDSTLYIDLGGSRFSGSQEENALATQYPPTLLLTAGNYAQVTGTDWGDRITTEFLQPIAPEEWALPEGAQWVFAQGTMTTKEDGTLLENTYSITYKIGQTQVSQTFTARPFQPKDEITEEFDTSAYTQLSTLEAPVLLERMSGYLLQASRIHSTYEEYIYCQTFGDQRTRNMQLTMEKGDAFTAALTTTATLVNSSRGEETSSAQQEEIFQDGVYSRKSNGGELIQDESIPQERFQTHCQDFLVGTVLLPQFVSSVTLKEDEDCITLHFTPKEELASLLCGEASQSLYQDPTVLSSMASSSVTEVLSAYLKVQKSTGLPLSSGIHYKGIFTITELPYRLEYTTDQNYFFGIDE